MNQLVLGNQISASAVAAQAGVATNTTPFLPTRQAMLMIDCDGVTGTPSITVQTSPDNATWTTVATITAQKSQYVAAITLNQYARLNVGTAGTAGTVTAWLES